MKYTRQLLNGAELNSIRQLIPDIDWVDGLNTTHFISREMKKNVEANVQCPAYAQIVQILMAAVNRDTELQVRTVMKDSKSLIISKMSAGGYYKPHQDDWQMGDYSTTIFLSDQYEGGELLVEDETYKLPIGSAVTYESGLSHSVSPVKSGDRIVAVFWTNSIFKDPSIRAACSDLARAASILGVPQPETITDCNSDAAFLVSKAFTNLMRRYGK